jgi:hypothetical protein
MVPSTVGAVVIFLLLVTPGTAFELLWQRTRPRRDESVFAEVSRVLLAGVLFSGAAILTLAVLAWLVAGAALDAVALLRGGQDYVEENAGLALRTAAAVVALALCYAVAVHDVLTPPPSRRITPGTVAHGVWSDDAAWSSGVSECAAEGRHDDHGLFRRLLDRA